MFAFKLSLPCILLALDTPAFAAKPQHLCRAVDGQWQCETLTTRTEIRTKLAAETSSKDRANHPLYWFPKENLDVESLSAEQQQRIKQGCCGAYLVPDTGDTTPPENAETRITAGGNLSGNPNSVLRVDGGVEITQGSLRLQSDSVEIDRETNTNRAQGNIEILNAGSLMVGSAATVNGDTGEAVVTDGQFLVVDQHLRGSAEQIRRDENDNLTLSRGAFTQCEPGHEIWTIRGSEIHLDKENEQGTAKHLRLELGGIPVFYFPYVSFPTGDKPKTGILYPSFSSKDFALPYYISIAPNLDFTVTPRYITQRGLSTELEVRHLNRWFETTLAGAWLGSGKDGVSESEQDAIDNSALTPSPTDDFTTADATVYDGQDRWVGSIQQRGESEHWFSTIDYTKVSDIDYFRHIDTANLDINRSTNLRQLGLFGVDLNRWRLTAQLEEFQNLVPTARESYQQKPRLEANGRYQLSKLDIQLDNQWTRFALDNNQTLPRNEGDRLRLDYSATWNQEWVWGFVKPTAIVRAIDYSLDEDFLASGEEAKPSVAAAGGALDMGLFFERDGTLADSGYLQTFEPRLFYFYNDYENQGELDNINFDTSEMTFSYNQLFRTTRFSGGDRIDDANQISVGLTSRFIGNKSGKERLSLSLGQIYYFDDRKVSLNGSQIPLTEKKSQVAGQISGQITDSLRLSSDILYNPETQKTDKGSVTIRYFDDKNRIFNLGYRYNRQSSANDDSQGELSVAWPITANLSLIARGYHDFTRNRELDTLGGIEYTSCCYRLRIVGRRWLDNELTTQVDPQLLEYDRGIFIEFQLRGIGLNIGDRLDSALSEAIYNFERRNP
ncbi:LPS-assembly protein LptD [Aurantivibrio plasticivorans]